MLKKSTVLKKVHSKYKNQLIFSLKGVIRVNCLDCLDRTNVVMTRIGIKYCNIDILNKLIKDFKYLIIN